ncbi:hypothetical protein [Flavobacterium hibisci]|uniref:hypothetical protein n=1 Tax=Flavobacterium hibisci TaxID=1914462 RepID=UPI001CC14667|nr:hypothetical protein [Flavobacterium hibisci]MBZ4043360.1 hypothetical protein [Flavobacterium hibisci]
MKKRNLISKLFLYTFFFLSSVNTLIAQSTIPVKNDNVILIIENQTAEENFVKFGKFLIEQGFSFATKDKDFLSLTTNERTSTGGYKYNLAVSFKDSIISIRPRCNYLLFGSSLSNLQLEWTDWSYTKSKSSPQGIAFKAFEPILRKYNGQLYFKKE